MELTISQIVKTYGGSNGRQTFGLTVPELRIELPSVLFLMGHNGSGKSVLLRMLAGEELPSGPHVRLCCGSTCWNAERKPCPVVRQNVERSLALDLTVEENLFLRMGGGSFLNNLIGTSSRRKLIRELLERHTRLKNKLREPCRNLSGGEKQALAFIAITYNRLPLLLLDEFLSSADIEMSEWLLRNALEYSASVPACVIIASHDVDMALAKANRIIILRNGMLTEDIGQGDDRWNAAFLRQAVVTGHSSVLGSSMTP